MAQDVSITFHMRNDDFQTSPGAKAAKILRDIAKQFEQMDVGDIEKTTLYDANGNKIGEACFCFETE